MKFWLSLLLVVLCFACWAQPALNKTYGSLTANTGLTIIPEQNGYFMAGAGYSPQFNNWYSNKIFRIDSFGNVTWGKDFGKNRKAYNAGIGIKLIDGGYAMPGWTRDSLTMDYSAFLLRLNSQGDTIWTQKIVGNQIEGFSSCAEMHDKSIVAFGGANNLGDINGDFLLVKYDSSGQLVWKKSYGGSKRDDGFYMELLPDGGFLLSGLTESYGIGIVNNYLIRTDSLGTILWQKTYGSSKSNGACLASYSQHGGYIMFGQWDTIQNLGIGGCSFISKLDSVGEIKWAKLFTGSGNIGINRIKELANGDIIAVGQRNKPNDNSYGGYITLIDSLGNTKWEKLLFYNGADIDSFQLQNTIGSFHNITFAADKGIVLTGMALYYSSPTEYAQKMWLVKTDSTGCIDNYCGFVGEDEIAANEQPNLNIYPNPAQSNVTVSWQTTNQTEDATITIFDLLGREVYQTKTQGVSQTEIILTGLQQGMYIIKVQAGSKVMTGKVMKGY